MVELNEWQAQFQALGVNVVAITYDDPSILAEFSASQGLGYPLLSDPGGEYMASLGIRNEEYAPGHRGFGIPHPGIVLIDPAHTIRLKASVPGYRDRPAFDELFDAVSAWSSQ